jgi:hypothetical protein
VHLAAAGLLGTELDFVAEAFEDAYDGFACLGEESVVVAGDEERDTHESILKGLNGLQGPVSVYDADVVGESSNWRFIYLMVFWSHILVYGYDSVIEIRWRING